MANYTHLINYIFSLGREQADIDFDKIEELIGESLPRLFFFYDDSAEFQSALVDNGYLLKSIDINSRTMTFKKMTLTDRTHEYTKRMYFGKTNSVISDVSALTNIFIVAQNYLIAQTRRIWPERITSDEEAMEIIEPYYTPNALPLSFENILEELASTLQTGQRLPNVIKFLYRKNEFREIFFNYDKNLLKNANIDELYSSCEGMFDTDTLKIGTSKKSWMTYLKGMINGAVILSRFSTVEEFIDAIANFNQFDRNHYSFDEYQAKSKTNNCAKIVHGVDNGKWKIAGMGQEIACNFLKELGLPDYIKPDTHIKDAFTSLGLCSSDDKECIEVGKMLARECGVSAYKLDRVIWLCCSGHYYKTYPKNLGGGADRLKQPFLNYLVTNKREMN